ERSRTELDTPWILHGHVWATFSTCTKRDPFKNKVELSPQAPLTTFGPRLGVGQTWLNKASPKLQNGPEQSRLSHA
ncbi:hypothetical protein PIB30_082267, partial [Stylosanthes scabra]|nr:hypothetical protein [Stylosanthes scabra]